MMSSKPLKILQKEWLILRPKIFQTYLCNKTSVFTYLNSKKYYSRSNSLLSSEKVKGELSTSPIRLLNIGKNYFRYINPRRKKILMALLNSYIKQFKTKESLDEIIFVLDLFYNNEIKSKKFGDITSEEMVLNESILWHLNSVIILDRIASQYSRYEFMEYDQIINILNDLPKEKRNKAKYVFTNHANQPNSTNQLYCINEIFKGLEENDLDYLDSAMVLFRQQSLQREFSRPSNLEELITYYSSCIPDLINSFSNMYELGLKDLSDFFEIPETCITITEDQESKVSLISYIHGLNINITIDQYTNIIQESELQTEMSEVLECFNHVKKYAKRLMDISDDFRNNTLSKTEFFLSIPVNNISGLQSHIEKILKQLKLSENAKVSEVSKKLLSLISVFKIVGVLVQIEIDGKDLNTSKGDVHSINENSDKLEENNVTQSVKGVIHDILKELSVLNSNIIAGDIIVLRYDNLTHYNTLQQLLTKYQANNIEIVPKLSHSIVTNDTNSNISLISYSKARQREGLLLTELRTFREYKNNPDKWIYMGQGNTAERGGGPFGLTHQKYNSLTRVQRQRHIRTIHGFYFTSEFCSKDLIFTFLVNGAQHLNVGDFFEPTNEYMEFLSELDSVVGVPQRELQKTTEFNKLYVENAVVKNLVEAFDYAGSEDKTLDLTNLPVKECSAIVQSYIFSDRCSFTHPELAFWDRLDESLIKKMAKNYYDNNRHFKYLLFNYGFMLKRFDLEFAKSEVGLDENNPVFKAYEKGRNALEKILNNIGLSTTSTPMVEIYNQHLGLLTYSSNEETCQKFEAYRMLFTLQNFYLRKSIREKGIGNVDEANVNLKKMRILQSALANISTFNGKG